jgi:hypothetical protein
MNDPRSDSLIQAIYEFDPTSKHLRACICSTAYKSPHYDDFLKLVLLNVRNPQFIYPSFNSDYFKNKFNDLLSRVEIASLFDEKDCFSFVCTRNILKSF